MHLLAGLFMLGALILVPLMIVGVFLRVLLGLILLPFKIVGGLLKAVFGLLGGLFGLAVGGVGLLLSLFVVVGVFLILPLAPLLLLGGIVWLALKAARPAVRAA
jgi:hypothetical protein